MIEQKRHILNQYMFIENVHLFDEKVVTQSQILDELILECTKCKERTAMIRSIKLDCIWGTHPSMYYYGLEHLIANLYPYIKKGIDKRELIHISMEHHTYIKLLETLKANNLPTEQIEFISVKKLILSYKNGGVNQLKETLENFINNALKRGFTGIRWIGQPTFAVQETSKEDFLNWEKGLTEALKNTKSSLLCIYDAYDYTHKQKFIDDQMLKESFDTHSHILKKSILENI